MFRARTAGPQTQATSVRAVVERDHRYLLARYPRLLSTRATLWTLPGTSESGATSQLLRDALWHDLGLAVRWQRRVGFFRDSVDGMPCLVVAVEVLGEPDPDPGRVLAVGWFTPAQVDALGRADLLAGGFESAAIERAQQQRNHTLQASFRHLASLLLAGIQGTPGAGAPDGVVVAGAPTPPGRTCWGCGLYAQHKPWCPAR